LAKNADRMARFQREAQVLASLNHPNIAAIYGLEESGGVRALVMELVEGPTLADRMAQGGVGAGLVPAQGRPQGAPLQIDESLQIARQIAEALEAAHEKNITHRDLKPANVKVIPEGTVKVLDFGLAKAAEDAVASGDPSDSPTLTAAATQAGMIMGTAAYMAPEQARGQAVDKRADIWSFGVVLFEMLTGRRAFQGETTSDVLASVLKFDPDWKALPASTPPSNRRR
jgi:serine/threonine-protein kinase